MNCYDICMQPFSLPYPVEPYRVSRPWGVEDPQYAQFGFKRHNGVDILVSIGQPIYVPLPCRVTKVGNEPTGSGIFVSVLSRYEYLFLDGKTTRRVELTFMHLGSASVMRGALLEPGDVLGTGGSTGRSSGPHTHLALKRVRMRFFRYRDADRNDAGNTIDPEPYWNETYATPSTSRSGTRGAL